MGAVYKSICYEADTFLLLATRLAEKEVQLKLDIEKLMNEGFVNIAKARYIMGSTCVTKMQLPTGNSNPIRALATVHRKEVDDSWVFYIIREDGSTTNEHLGEASEDSIESYYGNSATGEMSISSLDKSEAVFKHVLQTNPKSLKKSKKAFLVEDDLYQQYNDELLDEMSNSDSKESLVSVTDPIRLFGILVPNVLKLAQVIFNDVVNLLGECATVQFQLRETLEKYNHVAKIKSLIEEASEDMKLDVLTPKVYWTPKSSTTSCYYSDFPMVGEDELERSFTESEFSIQKSVRSVFYEVKGEAAEIEAEAGEEEKEGEEEQEEIEEGEEEEAEVSVWNSDDIANESDEN